MESTLGISVALATLFLILLAVLLLKRSKSSSGVDPLVRACFGDRGKAARLIAYELKLSPGLSEREARSRAFSRLEKDRSR